MKNGFVLFVVGLLIGVVIFFSIIFRPPASTPHSSSFVSPTLIPTFSIVPPPSNTMQGVITSSSGILLWESRTATSPSLLVKDTHLMQGTRLITQEKSTAEVQFPPAITLHMSETSDISFIQTLPIDFVVQQKTGEITYEVSGHSPLSIRLRSALLTLRSGTVKVSLTNGDSIILISTIKGTATIGFNDIENVTQVFTLREGQVYEYNSDERTAINSKNK